MLRTLDTGLQSLYRFFLQQQKIMGACARAQILVLVLLVVASRIYQLARFEVTFITVSHTHSLLDIYCSVEVSLT